MIPTFLVFLSVISLALAVPVPVPAPIPIFGIGDDGNTAETTPVSSAQIDSTLLRPAQFSRAVYCPTDTVLSWSCGLPCEEIGGVDILSSGGGAYSVYLAARRKADITVVDEGAIPLCMFCDTSLEICTLKHPLQTLLRTIHRRTQLLLLIKAQTQETCGHCLPLNAPV
jgi:hypothetical protein